MKTHYDVVNPTPPSGLMAEFYDAEQTNLRSRVSYVEFFEDDATTLTSASYYSYDIHGNVKEIVTDDPTLDNLGVRYKHMAYYYDLVSGKVNIVSYQNGYADQLWHRYQYDADNRLTIAETSSDSLRWERDAKYFYYLHGPLGRAEIGHDKVQGLDYAYTLHGWIKGINSNTIVASRDMGRDGALNGNNITASDLDNGTINTSNYNNMSAQDVFGYTLGYYSKDYVSVGTNNFDAAAGSSAGPLSSTSTDLFNGNISNWVMAFTDDDQERVATIGKLFAYDQLNRIRTVDCYADLNLAVDDVVTYNSFSGATALSMYEETFNYDPNGNIMVVDRTGDNAIMDDFSYHYKTASGSTYQWSYSTGNVLPADATNQLDHVDDDPLYDANYTDDVDDQGVGNYTYDEIGNLIDDNQEQIDNIEWTIYGKIRRITRDASSPKPDLEFRYDAMGNRICKIVKPKDGSGNLLDQKQWEYSYYNRDASGNVMAVYKRNLVANGSNIDDKMTLSEQHLYGSSRLGLIRPKTNDASEIITGGFTFTPGTLQSDGTYPVSAIVSSASPSAKPLGYRWMTRKNYELSNHLGNVYVVVKDKKLGIATSTYSTTVSYYTADVITANDYFAFGAPMKGRTFNAPDYRYSFNGKEDDPEVVGTGNGTQDYGMRIYNPALGKFLSVDPLAASYPYYTPYQFAGNMPIMCIDLDGCEPALPGTTEGQYADAPVQGHEDWGSNYHWLWVNGAWNSTVGQSGGTTTYSGGVRVYEAAEANGSVPGASSVAGYAFTVGDYTVTPNYVTNPNGEQVFSHYTASVMINNPDPASGFSQMARIDYIFGANDLDAFKENVNMYAGSANLMFGGNAHLASWQIEKLNGGNWAGTYVTEQLTDPYAWAGAISAVAAYKSIPNFTRTTMRRLGDPNRTVAMSDLQRAIRTPGVPDPQGTPGATAHYSTILRNGNAYNLKVVYNSQTNTILHFHFSRDAMGGLPKIPKPKP
jgi:RHS repeat-associated protein